MDTTNLRRLGATHIRTRAAYEQARDALEPEVEAAIRAGVPQTDIVRMTGLTRERLRQIRVRLDRDDALSARIDGAVSPETRAAIASVVEHTIEREHGQGDAAAAAGARAIALAGLQMDLHGVAAELGGDDRALRGLADTQLRILITQGLDARRCQCPAVTPAEREGHGHSTACEGHYEADVPEVDGRRLCGACYCAQP